MTGCLGEKFAQNLAQAVLKKQEQAFALWLSEACRIKNFDARRFVKFDTC
jgi:hypothetical protein